MTTEEHRLRHKMLHEMFDELFADYIIHHPTQHNYLELPIRDLMRWSNEQAFNPTEDAKAN